MKDIETLIWTPDMVRDFWNYWSRHPDRYFTFQHSKALVQHLKPHLASKGSVLDYGCGPGYLIGDLLESGLRVAGLDSSETTRQVVTAKFNRQANFLGAFDLQQLLQTDLRFDAVTVIEVNEHLYDEQLDELLAVLRQVLTAEGIVIFTTPNEEDLEQSYILCPECRKLFHRWQHVRCWSPDLLVGYLTTHGFEVTHCYATDFRAAKRSWLWLLKRRLKRWFKAGQLPPHMLAIARPRKTT